MAEDSPECWGKLLSINGEALTRANGWEVSSHGTVRKGERGLRGGCVGTEITLYIVVNTATELCRGT